LISLQNLLDPATLQRSPILTNKVSGVMRASSRPAIHTRKTALKNIFES